MLQRADRFPPGVVRHPCMPAPNRPSACMHSVCLLQLGDILTEGLPYSCLSTTYPHPMPHIHETLCVAFYNISTFLSTKTKFYMAFASLSPYHVIPSACCVVLLLPLSSYPTTHACLCLHPLPLACCHTHALLALPFSTYLPHHIVPTAWLFAGSWLAFLP